MQAGVNQSTAGVDTTRDTLAQTSFGPLPHNARRLTAAGLGYPVHVAPFQ